MSGFTLFTNSVDGISFEPEYGFSHDDRKIENTNRTRSALMASYKFSGYKRWKLPIRHVNSSDKQAINNWWNDNTELFFYDNNDTSAQGTYAVRIVNRSTPIRTPERPYDYEWRGTIELEEF